MRQVNAQNKNKSLYIYCSPGDTFIGCKEEKQSWILK